mmetsp:Transcript_2697/g.5222  ORF Transcript_2697/g.5222 Transcript_2697/m.5222 type:complete len:607 (-) Transcript_2697:82-1902(-)|eukprot:CAMPEP_0203751552 /NCGR_PEP_ID=MMETSP0098-20131031/5604_1 /ASSEMBLY_ACC=CAM_ASM_000208 /TAXON_ID=96639 /ORGANISM=" , Strain NY0313808BC1" /LENGTH=606 /DNA_ID=CAMNT_0050641323 /DNA_START=82 /DNA_END=1902 /DNA_ORIENTATION=-
MADAVLGLLKEEFKDNDLTSKRRASERLDVVAKALGPDKTKSELVPWLKENLQQEDEILYIFAKKVFDLLDLIGDGAAIEFWPVLEGLLEVEETFVRDRAVEASKKMIKTLTDPTAKNKVVESLIQLSKNDWFTRRMSVCALIGPVLSIGLSDEDSKRLKEVYFTLCKDETPMVRRAAAKNLGDVISNYTAEETVSDVMPIFTKLSADPQESVCMLWIGNVAHIAKNLTAPLNDEHIMKNVAQFCTDRSWRVRCTMANIFDEICSSVSERSILDILLPLYCELLRDPESEVRTAASKHVISICTKVGSDNFVEHVLPAISGLVEADQQRAVRINIATTTVSEEFAKLLGENHMKQMIFPIWEQFLRENNDPNAAEVRLIIVDGLNQIIKCLGAPFVAQSWPTLLRELFDKSKLHNGGDDSTLHNPNNPPGGMTADEIEHPQWRLRISILNAFRSLAAANDPAVDELILDLWASSLEDDVFDVRSTAARLLGGFCTDDSPLGQDKIQQLFIPRLLEFFKQAKVHYSRRIVFVHAFGSVAPYPALVELLYPSFGKCLTDKVPNVRLAAVSTLGKCDGKVKEAFAEKLNALSGDSDVDVSSAAKECLGV